MVLFLLAPLAARAEKLELTGNMVANLAGGEYAYDSVYVGETGKIRLRGDTILNVTGPVHIHGLVITDWEHLDVERDGAPGGDGADGAATSEDRGHGDPGGAGQNGGDGQNSFSLTIMAGGDVLITGTIDLSGGDGGNGGNGGDGHDGEAREIQGVGNEFHVIGNGGDGGAGGNGGHGGRGGRLTIRALYQFTINEQALIDLSGGDGGLAGMGGDGGDAVYSTEQEFIAHGGKGGAGGWSGNGGYGSLLTLAAGGCLTIDGLAVIDLGGGKSPDPTNPELMTGGFGGDGSVGSSLVGGYYAGTGGAGIQGGSGGDAGGFLASSAGLMTIGQRTEIRLKGGDGSKGGEGGMGGYGPDSLRTSCQIAAGGNGGDGGNGGTGGRGSYLQLEGMGNVNLEAEVEIISGSGGDGGPGGMGGKGGNAFMLQPPSCGYYAPGRGGSGGKGGNGGFAGANWAPRFAADETVFLNKVTIGSGDGGNGGDGGKSGLSGTSTDGSETCPGQPQISGNGGAVFGDIHATIQTGFYQGTISLREAAFGTAGESGSYMETVSAQCTPPLRGADGVSIGEQKLTEDRDYTDPFVVASNFMLLCLPGFDPRSEWAKGDCEACLPWDDEMFPECGAPTDGDTDGDTTDGDTTDGDTTDGDTTDGDATDGDTDGDIPDGDTPDGDENSVTENVGPEGGAVHHPDGASVEIPVGALDADTEISITKTDREIPGTEAVGPVFRFEPAGLQFASPVSVVLPYSSEAAAGRDVTGWWTVLDNENEWEAIGGEAVAAGWRIETDHFSLGAVGLAEESPADGDAPDGDTPDGDAPDGDTPDGDTPDGDAEDESGGSCQGTGGGSLLFFPILAAAFLFGRRGFRLA